MVTAEPVLRIHQTKDGRVWFGDDRRVVAHEDLDVEDFFAGEELHQHPRIRLLGTANNAALVERLHVMRKKAGLPRDQSVQVGSPAICRDLDDPAEALRAMWHSTVNQGVGCRWIEFEDKDFSTYAIVAELKRTNWEPNEKVRQILRYHPAWPALSFLPGLEIDAACVLIGKILDPRWFMHPDRPNRNSKLYKYLGITPENAEHLIYDTGKAGRHYAHCRLVFRTWSSGWDQQNVGEPSRFLHRILRAADTTVRGFLNANKKFIRFLREVWLNELTPHRELFDPELFFRSAEEATAYITHRRSLAKRRNGY